MSKFIRIKDRIFDETQHRHTIQKGRVSIMGVFYDFKEADTIQELFDLYIVVANGFPFQFPNKPTEILFAKFEDKNLNVEKIYGAIWIKLPNGSYRLEPVAEMNKDGVWELL